jgi:hypothetical protein
LYYYIWRNNSYLAAVHVNQNVTFYSDTSVNDTTPYTYFIRAGDAADNFKDSNVVTVGPVSSPPPPTTPPPNPCSGKALSDINCDGKVSAIDVSEFRLRYKNHDPSVDFDANKTVNAIDISIFRQRYKEGT